MGLRMTGEHEGDPAALRRVLFDVHVGGAREVYLCGTFNDWQPTTLPMVHTGSGRWEKELLLVPGRYADLGDMLRNALGLALGLAVHRIRPGLLAARFGHD